MSEIVNGELKIMKRSETGGQKEVKLARLSLIDPRALYAVAEVAGFGALKYGDLNYQLGLDWAALYDAGDRHRLKFWMGENLDSESGLHHMAHAAWNDLALLSYSLRSRGKDDRLDTFLTSEGLF